MSPDYDTPLSPEQHVDEIVQVFPLPSDDPYKLLQQLWYVERLYGHPAYLKDGERSEEDDAYDASQRYEAMLKQDGNFTPYPGVVWATRHAETLPGDISIVDLLATRPDIDTLFRKVKKFAARVSGIIDLQMGYTVGETGREEERQHRIINMEARLARLWTFLLQDIRSEFAGICAFDSSNFRQQVLHRLVLISQDTLPLPENKPRTEPLDHAVKQQPILYDHIIEAIEKGCEDDEELKLRELLVVWLISKVREAVEHMVGQEGERLFPGAVDKRAPATVFEFGDKKRSTIHIITVPMSAMRSSKEGKPSFYLRTVTKDGDGMVKKMKVGVHNEQPGQTEDIKVVQINLTPPHRESLDEPPNVRRHLDWYFPNTPWERWRYVRQKDKLQVDSNLVDLVGFLAGREFFATANGFIGLTSPETRGVRPGDNLMVMKGMSLPLIGRLEPSPGVEEPKGTRREIVGTAVVKDLDLNGNF